MNKFLTSILIPTYNRSRDLGKLVHYSTQNFDLSAVKFFVLDGSDNSNEIISNKSICNHNKIEYHHYGPETPYLQRILNGINTVETETATLLGDDDIIDPNGLTDCVNFLHNNEDYAVAHGKYIGFNYTPNGISSNETYHSLSIENDSALERLFNFLSAYTAPTYYAVNRTSLLQKSFGELIKNDFDIQDYVAAEIMVGAIPIVNGKLKRLDSFFQARRFIPATKDKYVVYPKYIMKNDFSKKMKKIKKSIIDNMPDREKIKNEIIIDAIDYSFASFFGQRLNQQEISQRFHNLGIKQLLFNI